MCRSGIPSDRFADGFYAHASAIAIPTFIPTTRGYVPDHLDHRANTACSADVPLLRLRTAVSYTIFEIVKVERTGRATAPSAPEWTVDHFSPGAVNGRPP